MRLLVIAFACLLVNTSCVNEIILPNTFEPRIVVFSVLVPGREVCLRLTSNTAVNDTSTAPPIVDAEVLLYRGDALLGRMTHTADGIYSLAAPIFEGETYTLKASCNGYPSIEATTTLPVSQTIEVRFICITEYNDVYVFNAYFPPTNELSYYAIGRFNTYRYIDIENNNYYYYRNVEIDYPDKYVEFFDNDPWPWGRSLIDFTHLDAKQKLRVYTPTDFEGSIGSSYANYLSNELFKGQIYTRRVGTQLDLSPSHQSFLNIYQLSAEFYKTLKGMAAQNEASDKYFATPVSPYNAIKGGAGLFGAALIHTFNISDMITEKNSPQNVFLNSIKEKHIE